VILNIDSDPEIQQNGFYIGWTGLSTTYIYGIFGTKRAVAYPKLVNSGKDREKSTSGVG
jgi:hypothetical protein